MFEADFAIMTGLPFMSASEAMGEVACRRRICGSFWKIAATATAGAFAWTRLKA